MHIYKTKNKINGKIYIGQEKKYNKKYFGSGLAIIAAIKKYGIENFEKEILQECSSQEELNEAEKYWIQKENSLSPIGYNISHGGHFGNMGEIVNRKISDSLKKSIKHQNAIKNPERNLKISIAHKGISYEEKYGRKKSIEVKDKIREKLKGRKSTKKGKFLSEETKNKIRLGVLNSEKFKIAMKSRKTSEINRKGIFQIWVDKYGIIEAMKKEELRYKKWLCTKNHNYLKN